MAKSKSNTAGKRTSSSSSKRIASSAENGRATTTLKKSSPTGSREFTGIEIGHIAGEVWGALSDGEGQTLAAIKKKVSAPADLVTAAIGWLARENKLEFTSSGRTVKISLR